MTFRIMEIFLVDGSGRVGNSGQRCVRQSQRARHWRNRDAGDSEKPWKLFRWDLERPRSRSVARNRLRISHGACGVEGDIPLDLLHDLMDVAVQDRHGTEAFEITHRLV